MKLSHNAFYNFDLGPTAERLVGELFFPYEVEIHIGTSIFIFGRFSIGLIGRLSILSEPPSTPTVLFRAGAFTEAHASSRIIIGGEHGVSSVLHNSFGVYGKLFTHLFPDDEKRCVRMEAKGVILRDGVILSADSTVIDGVTIGDGTVLAAGAVAVGDCGAYSIYGGVPAKQIKRRLTPEQITVVEGFDLARVRSHCLTATPSILRRLEQGQLQIAEARGMVEHMTDVPRIIMAGTKGSNNEIILGEIQAFQVGDRNITDEAQIKTLRDYFAQAKAGRSSIKWSPDVFHAIGAS
ncbi:2,3,4,5-tetrahydropyridine-2,6-dicarboxylate N-acetyltransferase [Methylobacterium adhaesivum]|uniref:Uncharacterized protein n=1 Tax=Methylobacterium adhaesivum TaxID=333297 RepID=A0ABT8BGL9_9HYPH|nr:hypothetical protein [Methylobacterium adhaesivum]MDN3590602.1 hypothetical protein [Methylobacterium adhaesivum]GJD30011.1 2,3,4,5-tetrahydropyridine-2,6-dicarboxylate N-acetyltransferase [Methylobacterium adhaesivum]